MMGDRHDQRPMHPATTLQPGPADQRLLDLGIVLPDAPAGLGAYSPWSRVESIVTTSGQFPRQDGDLAYVGRLGETLTAVEGRDAARLCAIAALAQIRSACGGTLAPVRRIVRVEGNLLCTPDFEDHATVLDGASDLLNAVFPGDPRHSRAVAGVSSMPLGAPVLLYVQAEIAPTAPGMDDVWTPSIREELPLAGANGRVGTELVSETDTLRVWQVRLRPGERLPFHTHVLNYFWTALTPGRGLSRHADGAVERVTYAAGDTRHIHFAVGESMTHDLENIGETDLLFATVEHLRSANPALPISDQPHRR